MTAETPDPFADRTYPARPFVGVGVVVLKGDHVLLVERGKPPRAGTWSIPGGAQHLGETVAEAGAREVREETGVDIRVIELVAVVDSIRHDDAGRVQYHYTLVDLVGEWTGGELCPGDDASDCRWVPLDEVAGYGMWAETERVIALAAAKRHALDPA